MRIIDIDGNAPTKKALSEMSMLERSALRQDMLRVDAGIDTVIETACDSCGATIRTRLEAEPSFYSPEFGCKRRVLPRVWRFALGVWRGVCPSYSHT